MIALQNLTYTYPGETSPALHEIDLHIPRGQFCGIIGANGAGKSTLCYTVAGFIPHFFRGKLDGDATVSGREIPNTPLAELAGEVGLVFQNPFNQISGARFTIREEVAFGLENMGVPQAEMATRVDEVLEITDLSELAERSPYALSGGQQQRLAIASMVVMRPKVLVLDEPTSQLDPAGTIDVFSTLRALVADGETTVVMAEHKLEWLAAFADRVIALSEGKIVADGPPREVLTGRMLEEHGIGHTRYTQAAHLAQARNLVDEKQAMPVTLDQAVEFFG